VHTGLTALEQFGPKLVHPLARFVGQGVPKFVGQIPKFVAGAGAAGANSI